MVHAERADEVQMSDPSPTSRSGCLKIRGPHTDGLYIFPPDDPRDAQRFLTALIDQATQLRDSIAVQLEARLAAA
jgi:hypothetical protein